jgi:hypothetical protein
VRRGLSAWLLFLASVCVWGWLQTTGHDAATAGEGGKEVRLAELAVRPPALTNVTLVGANASDQEFEVWNAGDGFVTYSIGEHVPWLTVSSTRGISGGEHDRFFLAYTTTNLAVGTYSGLVTVTAEAVAVSNSPQVIAVTMIVTNPPPKQPARPVGKPVHMPGAPTSRP